MAPRTESLECRVLLTTIHVDHVAAAGGDGTLSSPFQTIQQGLDGAAQLAGDDVVQVAPGTYAENLSINDSSGAVTLRGAVTALVQIQGGGQDVIVISQASDVTIADLSVAGGNRGIISQSGNLTVINVNSSGHTAGGVVVFDIGNVSVTNSTLNNNNNGLYVEDSGTVTVTNVIASGNNLDGVRIVRSGQLTVTDVTASNNNRWGIAALNNAGAVHVENATANQNGAEGLGVFNGAIPLTVMGGQFNQNGWHGIDAGSVSSASIQGVEVVGNGTDSINSTTGGAGIRVSTSATGATLSITDSEIRQNVSQQDGPNEGGGGVQISGSVVATIENSFITDNQALAGDGGGINIFSTGSGSVIRNTVIANNRARLGGGLTYRLSPENFQAGSLLIENSTFDNNTASADGGGLFAQDQVVTIRRSTFSNNEATGSGGGLALQTLAFLENSTVSGNSAFNGGGAAVLNTTQLVRFVHVTIADNTAGAAGGGLHRSGTTGQLRLANTLIAGNTTGRTAPDVSGNFGSLSFNLIGDATGSTGATGTDLVGDSTNPIDAQLDVLRDNGGPTLTLALLPDSPAIDFVGASNFVLATDQRGLPRPQGVRRDAGAYEWQDLTTLGLVLDIRASGLRETGTGTSTVGSVRLTGGTLIEDLVVTLSSNDPSELTLPAEVVIPAGSTSSDFFDVTAISDGLRDGNQLVTVTATAENFNAVTDTVTVIDNDGPNQLPVAQNQTFSVNVGETLNGQRIATDADGDPLTYEIVDGPDHFFAFGSSSNGSFNYRSQDDFTGTDTFTFRASDGQGFSNVATVTINVNAVNNAPVAVADAYSTQEDVALIVSAPPASAVDQSNEPAGFSLHQFNAGSLDLQQQVVAGRAGRLDSVDVFIGQFSDPGRVLDFFVNRGTAWQTDAPEFRTQYVLQADDLDGWVTLDVSAANVQLQQGEAFTIGAFSTAPDVFLIASNSDFGGDHYVPGSLWRDGSVDVTPGGNDYDLLFRTRMSPSGGFLGGVLANDTDADGDPLTAILVNDVSNGTLTLNPDGSFNYVPDTNFHGGDSFTYKANDGNLDSNTTTVSITVNPVNDRPVAVDDAYTIAEDGSLQVGAPGVLLNDTDVDGDSLTVDPQQNPANGSLQINSIDGSFHYVPNANFHGTDSFTYLISDGTATSANVATVTITVTPVPDAPNAVDDVAATLEETALTIDVLANDGDADGDPLSLVQVQSVVGGTALINPDHTITFTPAQNFFGPASFSYEVTDGNGHFDSATVVVSVANVNDPPLATNDTATTDEDVPVVIAVLTNDQDADGDPLSVQSVGSANGGVVRIEADGTVTYTPDANFNGGDSFTYVVMDGQGGQSIGTVSITVNAVNDPPLAVDDLATTDEDTAVLIGVLANDSDVDGDSLTSILVAGPSHGTLTLNADGSFNYVPDANFNGGDSFTYKVNDGTLDSNAATVSITVNAVNDPPLAVDDLATTDEDTAILIGVLANDSDADGDALLMVLVNSPTNGMAVVNDGGSITYTPNANFNGSDAFTYQISDGNGGVDLATVHLTIRPDADLGLPVLDIVPTDPSNSISTKGKFDLAILSSGEFDATTRIVVGSLTFGKTGDENSLVRHKRTGEILFRHEDVNGDGLLDLVVSVNGKQTGLGSSDTQALLKGDETDGGEFVLRDDVTVSSTGGNQGSGNNGGGKGGKGAKSSRDAFFAGLTDDEDWPF